MEQSTRRLMLAIGVSMLLMLGWTQLMKQRYPLAPAPSDPGAELSDGGGAPASNASTEPASLTAVPGETRPGRDRIAASAPTEDASGCHAVADDGPDLFELGADRQVAPGDASAYWLYLRLASRGAVVERGLITPYRNVVPPRKDPKPDPYPLLNPWIDPVSAERHDSFATANIRLIQQKQDVALGRLAWCGRREEFDGGERVVFEARVVSDGEPLLGLTKTFEIRKGSFDLGLRLDVRNQSERPVEFSVSQQGPLGLNKEDTRGHDRFVLAGVKSGATITATSFDRARVLKADERQFDLKGKDEDLKWVAHVNKWFIAAMSWSPVVGSIPLDVVKAPAFARTADSAPEAESDLQLALVARPEHAVPPGEVASLNLSVYLGPKDYKLFRDEQHHPQYVALNYEAIIDVTSVSCGLFGFRPLFALMRWLLHSLNWLFDRVLPGSQHYGWAIIVMVLIVRTLLHGLTKRQQIGMMRHQKRLTKLQPKIEAIKARFAKDPQQMNREVMNLYREEGLNPFGMMSGCVPVFIQMPIWVALWTTLNSSIELRHAPFILWMRDLAAPDALIHFGRFVNVPVLSWMTGPIDAFNVLPLVMGATMYAQQRLTQKLTRPDTPLSDEAMPDGRPSPAEQMRQQQKIMTFMTLFFSLMFYNFPCGLNLYIFTSSLFGMVEQYRIRTHLKESEIDGPVAGAVGKPRRKGLLEGWLSRLERISEEARKAPPGSKSDDKSRRRRPPGT